MEVGQVWVFLLDDAGDEVEEGLRAVRRLGLQQLKREEVDKDKYVI